MTEFVGSERLEVDVACWIREMNLKHFPTGTDCDISRSQLVA